MLWDQPSIHACLAAFLVASAIMPSAANAETRYVRADLTTGANNGTSWANAFRGTLALQAALAVASPGDEIWVAHGTYRTGSVGARTVSFQLASGVAIFGGFTGAEDQLNQRDPINNPTILSGDLAANGNLSPNQADNAFHVVKAASVSPDAILDGFTISGGVTDCCSPAQANGAGLQITGGAPTIRNCRFEQNDADSFGGDISITDSSPLIDSCTFTGTSAARWGLGIYHIGTSAATVRNCQFIGTPPTTGGASGAGIYTGATSAAGITVEDCRFSIRVRDFTCTSGVGIMVWTNARATIRRCDFIDNITCGGGGAIYNTGIATIDRCRFIGNEGIADGGAALFTNQGSTTVSNSVFVGNSKQGFNTIMAQGPITFSNCTFANNGRTSSFHWVIQTTVVGTTLTNCVLWNNLSSQGVNNAPVFLSSNNIRPRFDACLVQGWNGTLPGAGSFTADPKFVSLLGTGGLVGTIDDDVRVRAGSPCEDRGLMSDAVAALQLDLIGNPRAYDEPRATVAGFGPIDLGAYERTRPSRGAVRLFKPRRD